MRAQGSRNRRTVPHHCELLACARARPVGVGFGGTRPPLEALSARTLCFAVICSFAAIADLATYVRGAFICLQLV